MADPRAISYDVAEAIIQHLDPVSILLLSYKLTEDSTRRRILMYGISAPIKKIQDGILNLQVICNKGASILFRFGMCEIAITSVGKAYESILHFRFFPLAGNSSY